jgi:hypothetical protein
MRINLRTVVMFLLTMLIAISLRAQTEDPDWQDLNTHSPEYEGSTFPKEAEEAVLKAVLFEKDSLKDDAITVTNFVEFCSDFPDKQCFAAALYTFDPSEHVMDEIQFLVVLQRMSDARFDYVKLWEYRTGISDASGSLSVVYPEIFPGVTPCLMVKAYENNAFHRAHTKMICRDRSGWPQILWEYDCDITHESTGQQFRKSKITLKDLDNDHVNELVLDTVEGMMEGWEKGDSTFEIKQHRTVFYYSDTAREFLGTGLVPCD